MVLALRKRNERKSKTIDSIDQHCFIIPVYRLRYQPDGADHLTTLHAVLPYIEAWQGISADFVRICSKEKKVSC